MYNVTMSCIHTSVQGKVFQSVLKQEIAFFDTNKTGNLSPPPVPGLPKNDTNDPNNVLILRGPL
jgi:hypothetical protein